MPLLAPSATAYPAYWSSFLGVPLAPARDRGPAVVGHVGLHGYAGAWVFALEDARVVSVPPPWVPAVRSACTALPGPTALEDVVAALAFLPVQRRIGPALHLGIAQVPTPAGTLGPVTEPAQVRAFQRQMPADEWEHAGIEAADASAGRLVGAVSHGELVALAGYALLPGGGANPGVIVAPHARGHGYGQQVLAAVTCQILREGYLPVLQTLATNGAMRRCAEAIGYRTHATHVALRLAPVPDGGTPPSAASPSTLPQVP